MKISSLNVNGIANPIKRKVIFGNIRSQKANIHLLQETHSSPETGFLWAREWGGQIFYSHGSSSSKGVAIMLNRDSEYKIGSVVRDTEGRFIGMDLHTDYQIFSVCSIYAPTQDKPKKQVEFLGEVQALLLQLSGSNIILGGDLNCILDVQKDKNTPGLGHPQGEQGRAALKSLMDEWGLVDIWRIRHAQERGYTFRRGQYSSRLDLFLVSQQLADNTDHAGIDLVPSSDHAMVNLQLTFSCEPTRGPGFWKFQPELLTNPLFVAGMTEFLEEWEPPQEITSPTSLWEWLKHEIKSFVRHFTKTHKGA